jgi:4-hydroxybenzoate polyprenyltransferase
MVLLMTIATAVCGGAWGSVVLVLFASATGQATVGWTNDVFDAQTDRAAGRTTKPTVRGILRPEQFRVPIVVSATLTIPLSFLAAGWLGGAAHIVAVASALVYNFWLSRTIWSWLPYAVSFALMTVFVAQAASPVLWPSWPVVCLSVLIGVIAHLFNAIPDIESDHHLGLGGLAVSLGKPRSIALATVLMALGVVAAAVIVGGLLAGAL